MLRRAILAFLLVVPRPASAQASAPPSFPDVRDLPLVELRAKGPSNALAIVLSGDGGWADIDRQIGQTLAERGVDVIGFDDRAYLRSGKRDANGVGADVDRVA